MSSLTCKAPAELAVPLGPKASDLKVSLVS